MMSNLSPQPDPIKNWLQQNKKPELAHELINKYIHKKLSPEEKEKIETSIQKNPTYSLLFGFINQHFSKTTSKEKTQLPYLQKSKEIQELLLNLSSENASEEDSQKFISGLVDSPKFYSAVLRYIHQALLPPSPAENKELEKLNLVADQEFLKKIQLTKKKNEEGALTISSSTPKINLWDRWINSITPAIQFMLQPKLLGTAFALIACVFLSLKGVSYYQTDYKLNLANDLLRENYQVYYSGEPRLSGDYDPTPISQLLGPDTLTYDKEALNYTIEALSQGANPLKSQAVQLKIFIINHNYDKADSILTELKSKLGESAKLLNDVGVYNFKNNNWVAAKENFTAAIKKDANLKESYYNLALTEVKLNNKQNAKDIIEKYLKLETNRKWIITAKFFLENL